MNIRTIACVILPVAAVQRLDYGLDSWRFETR
jgi:hypothetical protein